jgi:hypothetical protein
MSVNEEVPCSNEDKIVQLMRSRPEGFETLLKEAIDKVLNINDFRNWREGKFSLLFHASLEVCEEAVDYLLEKGANPALRNESGACVLHLMAKRGQVVMAEKCYSKVTLWERRNFVNSATGSGRRKFFLYYSNIIDKMLMFFFRLDSFNVSRRKQSARFCQMVDEERC